MCVGRSILISVVSPLINDVPMKIGEKGLLGLVG